MATQNVIRLKPWQKIVNTDHTQCLFITTNHIGHVKDMIIWF